jgi:hypothetical protein
MYQSDVPAHEGPTNHGTLEFWTYTFPLSSAEQTRLINDLRVIPALLDQARGNLTGNARDLWVAGIENFKQQVVDLNKIAEKIKLLKNQGGLLGSLENALTATKDFITWLEEQPLFIFPG